VLDPYDPALDRLCAACAKELHGACMGWFWWCVCACGLTMEEPDEHLNGNLPLRPPPRT
jgi:hypothetical protein